MTRKLLILLLSLTFLVVFPGLTLAQFGSISGRVTDEVTGEPIIGAHVIADRLDSMYHCHGEARTDTGGYYAIEHLHPGSYQVGASAVGYVAETYPAPVTVISGQNTPDINFALTPGGGTGSISGRVTNEVTGNPILGAHVVAMGLDNYCYAEAWTDSNGHYMLEGLCAGIWQVQAEAFGYIPEVYPDTVTVVDGQNTPNINFALTPSGGEIGSISGIVTDEITGEPVLGAHIVAMRTDSMCHGHGEAWTDSNGHYIIQGLHLGSYQVSACKAGYIPETYPVPVTVVAGQNTGDIDFALTPMGEPGSISGTVTDGNTGNPIPHAHVCAHGELGEGHARTDSLGHYMIFGLYPGYYFVTAHACGYFPQTHPDTVTVIAGQNTPNVDFALVPYGGPGQGTIAGTVLDDSLLSPVPFGIVFAVSWNGNWGFSFTDSLGSYTIQGLQPDSYYVFAHAPGYIGEFYDNVYTWEEATLVTPDAYGINFYLGRCGHGEGIISGVINSNGSSLEGAYVYAEAEGEVKGFTQSSLGGVYTINGLLPGVYTVSASKVSYNDGSYPELVVIGSGKASGIDIELPPVKIGDVTGNGTIDAADVVFIMNYLYIGGPAPNPSQIGDANCDGGINSADVAYLINYLFVGGPAPGCP